MLARIEDKSRHDIVHRCEYEINPISWHNSLEYIHCKYSPVSLPWTVGSSASIMLFESPGWAPPAPVPAPVPRPPGLGPDLWAEGAFTCCSLRVFVRTSFWYAWFGTAQDQMTYDMQRMICQVLSFNYKTMTLTCIHNVHCTVFIRPSCFICNLLAFLITDIKICRSLHIWTIFWGVLTVFLL